MSDDLLSPAQRAQLALDGEFDAANQLAFERDMARSPELAGEYARLLRLRTMLREHAPREAAPERLRARLEQMVEAAPAPRRRSAPWAMAASVAAAIVLVAGAGIALRTSYGADPVVAALVAGYERAALSGQPIDVASSDRHTVKPWLASRAPLGSEAPDLADAGFPLMGGRIDIVDRRPVPTLVYRRREHLISVSELPLSEASDGSATLEGYHILRWQDHERGYVAISDIDATELAAFTAVFRRAAAG